MLASGETSIPASPWFLTRTCPNPGGHTYQSSHLLSYSEILKRNSSQGLDRVGSTSLLYSSPCEPGWRKAGHRRHLRQLEVWPFSPTVQSHRGSSPTWPHREPCKLLFADSLGQTLLWVELYPPKDKRKTNPQYLWMRPYLETGSFIHIIKLR